MSHFLAKLTASRNGVGRWFGRTRSRSDVATGRLRAAHHDFDLSVVALRTAALDHVDCQDLASTALRANLDRIARRMEAMG